MNIRNRWSRLVGAMALVLVAGTTTVFVAAEPAEAAVVRPFTLNYDQQVYGDYILAGNGNSTCPRVGDPDDPFGEPKVNCATTQAGTGTQATNINDSYYMRWADVDSDSATYNSSRAAITIPTGARVDFARLNWSGDTGTIRLADGTVSALPGCNTRQFLAGAGTANLPPGTPESTSVRLSVGAGATAAIAPQTRSRDALANVPASQPQFYAAFADVTSRFAGVATGSPVTLTVGNVWTPEGFGCYSGWSLTVVYAYDGTDDNAPTKKEVHVYDGHVRQSSVDPATTVTVNGFRASATGARVGLTAFEGDANISGDQFSINGTPVADPDTASTTNFFNSRTDFSSSPAVANNMSVDAKSVGAPIPVGATSANLTFSSAGDTFLATSLVFSVPVASLQLTTTVSPAGPYLAGTPITYTITALSPGSAAIGVVVDSPIGDCDRSLGNLAADVPVTYTCTGTADDDATITNTVTGQNPFGDDLSDATATDLDVIHPAIKITKTADQPSYTAGQTITFDIVVENTGDTPLTDVSVSDATVPDCDTDRASLAAGASFNYTCTAEAPIAGGSNTATVTATHSQGTVNDSSTVKVPTLGSVSGRVFADRDDDGDVDPGESGIGGVTITLTGTDADGSPVALTTTTDPSGGYTFADLTDGSYTVTETQPAAYDDGTDTVGEHGLVAGDDSISYSLSPGQSSAGTLFAEKPTSSISGAVYVDRNGNDARDAGEPGVAGTTVTLTGKDLDDHDVSLTATSDAGTGAYTFPGLRPGTYKVVETQPEGYGNGADKAGSSGGTTSANTVAGIDLAGRTDATGYLFGETTSSLSGEVYSDLDGNGHHDSGEPGIGGVTVTLTGTDPSGAIDPIEATTADDGSYSFTGLLAGTYTVTETQPGAYGDGTVTAGDADGTVGDNSVSGIELGGGTSAAGYLFGETTGAMSGTVFADRDGDGAADPGEDGISGVTITLTGTPTGGSPVHLTTTTDSAGEYAFSGMPAGSYTMTESQPDAYDDGDETAGSHATLGDDDAVSVTLTSGQSSDGTLFAEKPTSSLSGAVYVDLDADDTRGSGEPGVAGVTVTLTGKDLDDHDVSLTAVSDAGTGAYSFPGLRPGTYKIVESQPEGYADGKETAGSADGTTSANTIADIDIPARTDATGYLFGETAGTLSGAVYSDLDGNGHRDSGEPGIVGVKVTITGTDPSGAIDPIEATTGDDGSYSFTGLLGGTYTVTETQPGGYGNGTTAAGTDDGTVAGNSVSGIELGAGETATGYLFGETVGALSGMVFADLDGDGVHDSGEDGIGGVKVTLTGTGPSGAIEPIEATTGDDGSYSFTGLLGGTYTITETQPADYADGTETLGTADGTLTGPDSIAGIELAPGASATGYQFGEERGSFSGRVWLDADNNGVRDQGEEGVEGLTVALYEAAANTGPAALVQAPGTLVSTATTDADGKYRFGNLPAGSYRISVDPGAGRALTEPGQGDSQTGSDFDWVTDLSPELVVDFADAETTTQTAIDAGISERADDLAVALTAGQSPVTVGDDVEFTALVSNHGVSPVTGTTITVTLPDDVQAGAGDGEGWACTVDGQTVTCTTSETVLPGDSLSPVTISGTTTAVGDEPASAIVALDDGTDVNEENNAATAPLTVEAVVVPPTDDPTDEPTTAGPTTGSPTGDPTTGSPTGDPTTAPTSDSPTTAAPTAAPSTSASGGGLPRTGGSFGPFIGFGLIVLAGGVAILAIGRRRSRATH